MLMQVLPSIDYTTAWAFPLDHAMKIVDCRAEINRASFAAAKPAQPKARQTRDMGGGVSEVTTNLAGLAQFLQTGRV